MQRALVLARQGAALGEVPVGALIVHNDSILGEGFNQPISSCDPTAHAEVVALRAAALHLHNYRIEDATLYVTLEPCTMCVGALVHARIRRLVFAASEPRAGSLISARRLLDDGFYNHRFEFVGGVCADDSAELLRAFFRARRSEGHAS